MYHFRQHVFGGALADTDTVCVSSRAELLDHLKKVHPPFGPEFDAAEVKFEAYMDKVDERIGWVRRFLVTQGAWGVVGYTDAEQ